MDTDQPALRKNLGLKENSAAARIADTRRKLAEAERVDEEIMTVITAASIALIAGICVAMWLKRKIIDRNAPDWRQHPSRRTDEDQSSGGAAGQASDQPQKTPQEKIAELEAEFEARLEKIVDIVIARFGGFGSFGVKVPQREDLKKMIRDALAKNRDQSMWPPADMLDAAVRSSGSTEEAMANVAQLIRKHQRTAWFRKLKDWAARLISPS